MAPLGDTWQTCAFPLEPGSARCGPQQSPFAREKTPAILRGRASPCSSPARAGPPCVKPTAAVPPGSGSSGSLSVLLASVAFSRTPSGTFRWISQNSGTSPASCDIGWQLRASTHVPAASGGIQPFGWSLIQGDRPAFPEPRVPGASAPGGGLGSHP